ncbi:GGDEF domain-containing protein [Pseudomonas fontis]|uniref:diguanylate cyclase n=1 Tax=Pseudomonas fontis TaxID=2942633 RepID=A0ABT5NPY1_9PSED|nr:GGDEF domain-containing protein [Pseudomonas fontis]MDD0974728.1 GGDEF domain-containing protein [Pseudomonas fontis]MDD0990223.1 GGDEF domain-containing protein [Pseudomonas fontis]
MFKTIEEQVRRKNAPAQLREAFRQHDFERLRGFCILIFCVSIAIWLIFDLLVSFLGEQGFSFISVLFVATMGMLTVILLFVRKAEHFSLLNLVFIAVIALGIRLVIDGIPTWLRPAWLVLGASTILYSASVLPVRRWSFFSTLVITWVILNPYSVPGNNLFDLRGLMIFCYASFLSGLTVYSYLKLRQVKLQNFYMSHLLLDQAYIDVLTEIPNRRSFMAKAEQHLQHIGATQGHYLAMIDIDNFKRVNDRFGHDSGDVVLKRIAATIKGSVAEFEYARLGGEEFVIYLWGIDQATAEARMAQLCRQVRDSVGEHPVTVSIGLTLVAPDDSISQALGKADEALYSAKHGGKDRYVLWRATQNQAKP